MKELSEESKMLKDGNREKFVSQQTTTTLKERFILNFSGVGRLD
jgi:hypothetical protein